MKPEMRTGIKRAAITLAITASVLFGLAAGFDYILGRAFLSFAEDSWELGVYIALIALLPCAGFASAFKRENKDGFSDKGCQ